MVMRNILLWAVLVGSAAGMTVAAGPTTVEGTYVEARTAEVFAGGCIINGEAGTAGREAVLAWKVDRGRFNGVPLDGLAVVAAVAADGNLGVHEIGGDDANTRAALFLDERATPTQRQALVSMVKALSGRMVGNVVEVSPTPIQFVAGDSDIRVATKNVRLTVRKAIEHTATCGNKKWFSPLSTVNEAEMGTTAENAFSGASLGTKWSDPDKRSAFFGTFSY
jgi:hypothetical protein